MTFSTGCACKTLAKFTYGTQSVPTTICLREELADLAEVHRPFGRKVLCIFESAARRRLGDLLRPVDPHRRVDRCQDVLRINGALLVPTVADDLVARLVGRAPKA